VAAEWTVAVHIHKADALTNSDDMAPWDAQDMYRRISIEALVGSGATGHCSNEDNIDEDENHVTPSDWGCTMKVSGGPDTLLRIKLELWDDDWPGGNDELDLNPDHSQLGLDMRFEPRTSKLAILGVPGFETSRCALGQVKMSGLGGGGDEPADIVFSVSASPANAVDGETDGDSLLDSWEACGLDTDGNATVDLNLPAIGADPFRKDVFVEVDWMVDRTSTQPHSHEPWLPAMINAWAELDQAAIANPTVNGVKTPPGIALHVDTGTLYAGYTLDVDGDSTPEFVIPGPDGNLDLALDPVTRIVKIDNGPIPDIGNLRLLSGSSNGGEELPETTTLQPNGATPPSMLGIGSTFAGIKGGRTDPARRNVFNYAVFGHTFNAPAVSLPAGTLGLGETPGDDFIVMLGPLGPPALNGRQRVDADRDGASDAAGAFLLGPSGLQVDGTFAHHVRVFLHELGHNMSLQHGGSTNVNNMPNYLSTMNSIFFNGMTFDFANNDGIGDATGVDFDADGITDVRRFPYSRKALPTLNEAALDETKPIDPSQPGNPAPPTLTRYSCVPPAPGVPPVQVTRADRPVNWDCDTVAGETGAQVNNNNINNLGVTPSPPNEPPFVGFDDYAQIAASTSIEEEQHLNSITQRILEPPGREWFDARCTRPRRIDFEEFPDGTVIDNQYGPLVRLLADELRTPTIVGPAGRNGVPTASSAQALLNAPRVDMPAPLVMTFDPPQRAVRLHLGQAGLTNAPRDRVRAVLRAFDQNELPMGVIVRPLPPPNVGVTEPVNIAAIFPDELIRRVELSFEAMLPTGATLVAVPIAEPVLIDDLVLCARLDETGLQPFFPAPPEFGESPVQLRILSEALHQTPGFGPSGKPNVFRAQFTGLPVAIDGNASTTGLELTRPEGTTVQIEAPGMFSNWRFLYWRHSSGVSFGNGLTTVPLTLLRDGTLTAVYEGRRQPGSGPGRGPTEEQRIEGIRRCVDQCFPPHARH
jgi:hypothetical protein